MRSHDPTEWANKRKVDSINRTIYIINFEFNNYNDNLFLFKGCY